MATGTMAIMGRKGDVKQMWDRDNADEVAAARKTFTDLRGKGFLAYRAEGRDGRKGEVITEFDPDAERVILVPPVQGGQE